MQIVQYPNEILTTKIPQYDAAEIAADIVQARQMAKFMLLKNYCLGIAAPQVGIAKRFCVLRVGTSGVRYCFSPFVQAHGRDIEVRIEGCMSLGYGDRSRGGIFLPVPRWRVITAVYLDENGNPCHVTMKGMEARAFQHECDHLNGLLIINTEKANDRDTGTEANAVR